MEYWCYRKKPYRKCR
nr:putative antimicrobial protein [synthetic construct]